MATAGAVEHRWNEEFCSCGQDAVTCHGCGKRVCGSVSVSHVARGTEGNIGPCCFARFGLGHQGSMREWRVALEHEAPGDKWTRTWTGMLGEFLDSNEGIDEAGIMRELATGMAHGGGGAVPMFRLVLVSR